MKNQTEKTYCSHCGELIDTDDYELINGSIVCSDCVEMHTVVCDQFIPIQPTGVVTIRTVIAAMTTLVTK